MTKHIDDVRRIAKELGMVEPMLGAFVRGAGAAGRHRERTWEAMRVASVGGADPLLVLALDLATLPGHNAPSGGAWDAAIQAAIYAIADTRAPGSGGAIGLAAEIDQHGVINLAAVRGKNVVERWNMLDCFIVDRLRVSLLCQRVALACKGRIDDSRYVVLLDGPIVEPLEGPGTIKEWARLCPWELE